MAAGRGKKGFLFVRGTARRVEDPLPVALVTASLRGPANSNSSGQTTSSRRVRGGAACVAPSAGGGGTGCQPRRRPPHPAVVYGARLVRGAVHHASQRGVLCPHQGHQTCTSVRIFLSRGVGDGLLRLAVSLAEGPLLTFLPHPPRRFPLAVSLAEGPSPSLLPRPLRRVLPPPPRAPDFQPKISDTLRDGKAQHSSTAEASRRCGVPQLPRILPCFRGGAEHADRRSWNGPRPPRGWFRERGGVNALASHRAMRRNRGTQYVLHRRESVAAPLSDEGPLHILLAPCPGSSERRMGCVSGGIHHAQQNIGGWTSSTLAGCWVQRRTQSGAGSGPPGLNRLSATTTGRGRCLQREPSVGAFVPVVPSRDHTLQVHRV